MMSSSSPCGSWRSRRRRCCCCCRSKEAAPAYEPAEKNSTGSCGCGGLAGALQSSTSTGGVVVLLLTLVLLVACVSTRWIDGETFSAITSWTWSRSSSSSSNHQNSRSHNPLRSKPITFACPNQTSGPFGCRRTSISLSPSPSPSASPNAGGSSDGGPSCPAYFRWIHEDLRPWRTTGITRAAVEAARKHAAFRLLVVGGRLYVEQYHRVFQTRDLFTLWGFVQLANRYPGRLPDLDLMFNCEDLPVVKAADYGGDSRPLPPVFRYCKDDSTVDIVFPDWSFWGWPEVNIKPWETLSEEMKATNERVEWKDRKPFAYWRGNQWVSVHRQDLMKCNPSGHRDWNARAYAQDWEKEAKNGFKESNLAKQCTYRYKMFVEGRAWSVSEKYTLACNSPALFVTTHFSDFMTRGLMPGLHFWPIAENSICRSIKFAVDWGNKHQKKAQAIGRAGSSFVLEEVKMEYVYQYMLHLLNEYAKLLRFEPTLPEGATELCLESLACGERGKVREFLLESMAMGSSDAEPCALQPPYTREELEELRREKADAVEKVEKMEKAWKKMN